MPFDEADFTRNAAELVAQGDRVPTQRAPDSRPIEAAGTVIEIEGGMRFVSNGAAWLVCGPVASGSVLKPIDPEQMNRRYMWWIVAEPVSAADERMSG